MNFALYHDLKNPASGILSACQSLLDDFPETKGEQAVLLRAIERSCRSILQQLDDNLELADGQTPAHKTGKQTEAQNSAPLETIVTLECASG